MRDFYLDFNGWIKLDPNTRMQYIGNDKRFDPIITVAVWQSLPEENRGEYILEDFVAAVRDGKDIEFNELTITEIDSSNIYKLLRKLMTGVRKNA